MACLWILANLSLMIKLVNSFFLNSQLFEFTCDSVTLFWPTWPEPELTLCLFFRLLLQLRSLHQTIGADGTLSPLSLYTSPSLPNISLGLPANTHITVGQHAHTDTRTHTSTCKGRVQVEVHVVFLMKYLHHWCWVFICFIWTEKYSDVMMFLEIICSRRFKPRRQTG